MRKWLHPFFSAWVLAGGAGVFTCNCHVYTQQHDIKSVDRRRRLGIDRDRDVHVCVGGGVPIFYEHVGTRAQGSHTLKQRRYAGNNVGVKWAPTDIIETVVVRVDGCICVKPAIAVTTKSTEESQNRTVGSVYSPTPPPTPATPHTPTEKGLEHSKCSCSR